MLTVLSAGMMFALAAPAQTLFTYGTKTVSQQEFTRAFEKNPSPGNRQKAMKDYLPLFINYKLKVQDAIDKKLDTLSTQKSELETYHSQLVDNYINNKANTNALVKEAFERSQKDILLGHLFIGFSAADSASVKHALQQAEKATAALDAKQDFETVVKQFSTDVANRASGGRVGWITVFSVPYPFETIIYDLPVGGYSKIAKSSSGFHIFKKISERPAAGTVKVAQIMLVNPEPGNQAMEAKNKKIADSLYTALINGASFDSLAYAFSNDRTSYENGGSLPEFGVGTYAGTFEDMAFSLKSKGEISKPFSTDYGWHILKLLDKKPAGTKMADVELNSLLVQKVNASGRAAEAKNAYLQSQMAALKYKSFGVNEKELFRFTDSAITNNNVSGLPVTAKTPLFSLGKTIYYVTGWLQYVKGSRFTSGGESKPYPLLLREFNLAMVENYLHKNIEKIDPSFARQYREFREANLLFEAMDRNVWSKASADSAGLRKWYESHKEKYRWAESAAAILVTITDSSIIQPVIAALKKDPSSWKQLAGAYGQAIIADSGRYEINQIPGNNTHPKAGEITNPVKNELDGSVSFALIINLLTPGEPRSFDDSRGFVINDYQQALEQKWVANLKKKYPVKLNQPVWNKLISSTATTASK